MPPLFTSFSIISRVVTVMILLLGSFSMTACTTGLKNSANNQAMMPDSATGVCAVGYAKPFPSTKGECFDQNGLFEQTDNPARVIADYQPPKRPPAPVVVPVAQPAMAAAGVKPLSAQPSTAKQAIDAAEASGEEKAPCYLKGSNEPFMMAKSICLSSGGQLSL